MPRPRHRLCDKCGSMADSVRTQKRMVVTCAKCGYRVTKNVVRKGGG